MPPRSCEGPSSEYRQHRAVKSHPIPKNQRLQLPQPTPSYSRVFRKHDSSICIPSECRTNENWSSVFISYLNEWTHQCPGAVAHLGSEVKSSAASHTLQVANTLGVLHVCICEQCVDCHSSLTSPPANPLWNLRQHSERRRQEAPE